MRYLLLALLALCLPAAGLRAADDDSNQEKQAPEEIPNFNQLDEFVYVPKSTLSLGTRYFLRGPKATFGGQGANPSPVNPDPNNDYAVANVSRTYIDGSVYPDARTESANTGFGSVGQVGIPSDGRTNNWSYDLQSQILPDGNIAFHSYGAQVTDTDSHQVNGAPTEGVELVLDRDMGNLGKHFKWRLTAGFSIADIHANDYVSVPTEVSTLTDTYNLFGQVPPAAPFNSPTSTTENVLGQNGQVVSSSSSGSANQTQTVNQVILLGNVPIDHSVVTSETITSNRYWAEGAYYTLRAGPTLALPIGSHFEIDFSAGPALIYAGDVYNVLEDFEVATGINFQYLYTKENSHLLLGYYADLDLKYQLTDTAGFYIGSTYQGAGSFSQSNPSGQDIISGSDLNYTAKFDFGSQETLKTGFTVRF
jgi:hypothetical protein